MRWICHRRTLWRCERYQEENHLYMLKTEEGLRGILERLPFLFLWCWNYNLLSLFFDIYFSGNYLTMLRII